MKQLLAVALAMCLSIPCFSQAPFITQWNTGLPGISTQFMIRIPLAGTLGVAYDFTVDWGDGSIETFTGALSNATHTYGFPGIYTVSITGSFPRIYFFASGDQQKLLKVMQWGDIQWQSMEYAFRNCINMNVTATDEPLFQGVISLRSMFEGCTSLTASLGNWNMTNVASIQSMFEGCIMFNGNIGGWNTANVVNMQAAFRNASLFNADLSQWTTNNTTNMSQMFQNATGFKADLSQWNVSNVTNFQSMFNGATSFDENLSTWQVTSATIMLNMLDATAISTCSYDQMLNAWKDLTLQPNVTLGALGLQATGNAAFARAYMENIFNWSFTDSPPLAITYQSLNASAAVATNPLCHGDENGSIHLNLTSGVAPYSVAWFNDDTLLSDALSLDDLPPGTYTASFIDAIGCSANAGPFTLADPSPLAFTESSVNHPLCAGEDGFALVAAAGGSPPYTYAWHTDNTMVSSASAIAAPAGTYAMTLTDVNGCLLSTELTINEPDAIVIMGDVVEDFIYLIAEGGTGVLTYSWSGPNAFSSDQAQLSNIANGDYTVTVTDENNCQTSETFTVDHVGLSNHPAGRPMRLYPNPTAGSCSVSLTDVNFPAELMVNDASGRQVLRMQLLQSTTVFELFGLPAGCYQVTVFSLSQQVLYRQPLMVMR